MVTRGRLCLGFVVTLEVGPVWVALSGLCAGFTISVEFSQEGLVGFVTGSGNIFTSSSSSTSSFSPNLYSASSLLSAY